VDWRKRQIVQALKVLAMELEQHEPENRDLTVVFEGQRYLILQGKLAADLVYLMRKAAAWMEQEEGENGEEAEA
jgi:hypothetical protein